MKRPAAPLPVGVLRTRQAAQPALLRMLSRARRHAAGLLLIRLQSLDTDGHDEIAFQRFLCQLSAQLRIGDLVWQEAGGVVMLLLEDAGGDDRAPLIRLEQQARRAGAQAAWHSARFPEQGLTLQALLEALP